jgi:multimeric flavodoxin WrbA
MAAQLLGLSCGNLGGSAEILLQVALTGAEDAGVDVTLVRLDELRIPSGPDAPEPDDIWWFWERLVECDAWVISSPIISRTVTARLKLLTDRLLGPNADAAIIQGLLEARRQGADPSVPFRVDERVLKPRVAGFIAVGGALTSQWHSLALPVMHTAAFSMHIKVVDQILVTGAGTPRSVVLDNDALARANRLGRNVAGQIGRTADDAEYLGPAGLCPMCHLDVVVLHGMDVQCATCGAQGVLEPHGQVTWTELTTSVISMDEKRDHYQEILDTAGKHAALADTIAERAGRYASEDRIVRPENPVRTRERPRGGNESGDGSGDKSDTSG